MDRVKVTVEQQKSMRRDCGTSKPKRFPHRTLPAARVAICRCVALLALLALGGRAAADEPLPRFSEVCFAPFDVAATPVDAALWQRWIEPVAGQSGSLQVNAPRSEPGCRLSGTLRLVPTWTDGSLLRMLLQPSDHFCIHLFHGVDGVSLRFDVGQQRWDGLATTRQRGACQPDQVTWMASDDGRTRRSQFGNPVPIALHYQQGEVIVTRGDLILLGVPLNGLPKEVYLQGRTELRHIDRVVCTDLPSMPTEPVRPAEPPAAMSWSLRPGARASFQQLDTGAVQLRAENTNEPGWVTAPIVADGPCELLLRFDHVAPGTGVYLSPDKDAQPNGVLHFIKDQATGRTGIVYADRLVQQNARWGSFPADVPPTIGDTVWLRMVYGAGTWRWWFSHDGRHWAAPEPRLTSLAPGSIHLGLCHGRGAAAARIELGAIARKPLEAIASSCPQSLRVRARRAVGSWRQDQTVASWQECVHDGCPSDVDEQAWTGACSIAAISGGTDAELGNYLLAQLVERAAEERWPLEHRLELLNEVSLLADSRLFQRHGPSLPQRYFELARTAWRQEGIAPFNFVRRSLMSAPLDQFVEPAWPKGGIIRDQILDGIYRADWQRLRSTCSVLNYFMLHQDDLMVVWADQLAAATLGAEPIIRGRRIPRVSWPSLLSESLNRDVYNQNVELEMLIQSGSWEDAARQIATAMTLDARGVAPAAHDPDLLVSSAAAVRTALLEHGELARAVEDNHGELLRLQVERAIAGRQTRRLEEYAERFPGTSAARTAETWLGDQRLARGQAARALAHYRRAWSSEHLPADESLPARLNLAAAYAGQPPPVTLNSETQFGDVTMQPAEVMTLVDELLQRDGESSKRNSRGICSSLASQQLRTGRRIALPLAVGSEPTQEILPGMDRQGIDWPGRQLAVLRTGDRMLVHNRFELLAIHWRTGQSQWTNHPMGEETLHSRDWPLIPMRPLVHEQRVVARHLSAKKPQLACWDLASGELLWTSPLEGQLPVSDPFELDGALGVLTMDEPGAVDTPLRLQWIDTETGQASGDHTLVRLRDAWWRRSCCQVLAGGDRLFVVLGGVAFACDHTLAISWVRTSRTTPPEADPTWIAQWHQVPLLAGERLVLPQVGVRAVELVDPTTGTLLWRSIEPHLQRVIGVADNLLIIQTQAGLAALNMETGTRIWQQDQASVLLAAACLSDHVLFARAVPATGDDGRQAVELVLLDARSGRPVGVHSVAELLGSRPHVGPLIAGDDRAWILFSMGTLGGQRELLELLAMEGKEEVP